MKKILTFIYFLYLPICFLNAQYWRLTGNTGTTTGTNFVGTIDPVPLMFKVSSQKAGYLDFRTGNATSFGYQALNIDNGTNNSAFGYQALLLNYNGQNNTALGYQSLYSNSPYSDINPVIGANNNTGIGFKTLFSNTSGGGNTAIGSQSLFQNTGGGNNTAIGSNTLYSNKKGNYNTATGNRALYANTTGSYNIAYGNRALQNNNTGSKNIAIGNNALFNSQAGVGNVAIGDSSLFMYNYVSDKGSPEYNLVAVGRMALTDNTFGSDNTALGALSLEKNTSGGSNTATGASSMTSNITGSFNTSTGVGSMYNNTSGGSNTASGYNALLANTTGSNNTVNGESALNNNINGNSNVAIGSKALYKSKSNSNNVAIGDSTLLNYDDNNYDDFMLAVGSKALLNNTTGFYNTAVGAQALRTIKTGNSNTGLGYKADVNSGARFNATALGYGAIATADNQVMLGNTSVTSVKAAGSFVIYSDGRFKKNIKENVPGLKFITQLKPVTYNYDIHGLNKLVGDRDETKTAQLNRVESTQEGDAISKKEKKLYTGFVAQEVEKVADKLGYDFSGVYKPQNDEDAYGLSYADFVVPLVKAVQELSQQNDSLKKTGNTQQRQLNEMQTRLDKLEAIISRPQTKITSVQASQTIELGMAAKLDQNIPNPFTNTTTIYYYLPFNNGSAYINFYNVSGSLLKSEKLSGSGYGNITVKAHQLPAGIYQYSLLVDNKLIGTKQMIQIR